ncbi:MAG: MBL fold metallo-hydrolase [Candidatus Methanospirareceae archaeon]
MVTITIVYDNNPWDSRMRTGWGFSCFVKKGEEEILFDTGGDPSTLIENMRAIRKEPADVDIVVLSHPHSDHTGGLSGILERKREGGIKLYLGSSFPDSFKEWAKRENADVIEIRGRGKICEDFYTTGELGVGIKEQSLIVTTEKGLVVITGCAHPGIVSILEGVKEWFKEEIYLVLGGFHLGAKDVSGAFRRLGVKKVAPCHCTGDKAVKFLENEYKGDFIRSGVGKVIEV